MKNSDLIANFIHEIGVKNVPVFQGGNILHLIDSIAQHSQLNIICPLHEQSLSMIVETQARLSGYGVGVVTSGPGATNITTGVADAYYDSIPCMFFAGQVGMYHLKQNRFVRQRGFQETDTVMLFSSITKFSTRIERPEDTLYILRKAYKISISGRPGPVFIELPYNIQIATVNNSFANALNTSSLPTTLNTSFYSNFATKHDEDITFLINSLFECKSPVFIFGGGVLISKQAETVFSLVKTTHTPSVVTWPATGIFNHDDDEYFGTVGRSGHSSANVILDHADLVVCFGTRMNSKVINEKSFGKNCRVIAIDIDENELHQGLVDYDTKITADLLSFLPKLSTELTNRQYKSSQEWLNKCLNLKFKTNDNLILPALSTKFVDPELFLNLLSEYLHSNCRILLDTGCNLTWSLRGLKPKKGQRFISAFGHSPMGFSLPAVIGAHLSNKDEQILAIIGDGGFQINIQELHTIVNLSINVIIIILNNQCLGNTKFPSKDLLDGRSHGNDQNSGYSIPNLERLIKAYDINYVRVQSNLNLNQTIKEIFNTSGPIILELNVDPDQCPIDNW